jgi:hypothetical protein
MKKILCAAPLLFATAGCLFGEPNVYSMPAAEAYRRLASVRIEPSGSGPFGMLETIVTRSPPHRVTWTGTQSGGGMGGYRCGLTVTPVDDASSRVDVSCNGGGAGSGAAAGLESNLIRKRVIEQVDATLTGRDFDPRRANGATAAGWPADVVDHGTLGDAVNTAREMDAETRRQTGH